MINKTGARTSKRYPTALNEFTPMTHRRSCTAGESSKLTVAARLWWVSHQLCGVPSGRGLQVTWQLSTNHSVRSEPTFFTLLRTDSTTVLLISRTVVFTSWNEIHGLVEMYVSKTEKQLNLWTKRTTWCNSVNKSALKLTSMMQYRERKTSSCSLWKKQASDVADKPARGLHRGKRAANKGGRSMW